nr:MAG TPA: hypothetical protein [Caudoviricetes sp.]DAW38935.1 MAG TPA: hypothetical protein [Caudoviricetes sp.]
MALTDILLFGACSALLNMGAKMPPGGNRRPHKRREVAGGYRRTWARESPPQESPGRALVVFKIFLQAPRSP